MLLTLWDEQGNGIDSETATDGDAAVRMAINLLARTQTLRLSYQLTVAIWDDGAQRKGGLNQRRVPFWARNGAPVEWLATPETLILLYIPCSPRPPPLYFWWRGTVGSEIDARGLNADASRTFFRRLSRVACEHSAKL
jgi:hypothetical protein